MVSRTILTLQQTTSSLFCEYQLLDSREQRLTLFSRRAAIPVAIFAYIGVELLTTTAFEARDPKEMKFPASNVGWFSLVLYALSTGSFVANVSWQDQQLPKLFKQALVKPDSVIFPPFPDDWPQTHAAPLIALLRQNQRTLPAIVNGCLIYSGVSCANTALYVASRQLYGLARSIKVDRGSSRFARIFVSLSAVHPKWQTPWMSIFVSGLVLVWLPFIKLRTGNREYLEDVSPSVPS
jgi:yeast amino acid transporter